MGTEPRNAVMRREATALLDRGQALLAQARETQCRGTMPVRLNNELLDWPMCPLDKGHAGPHQFADWVPAEFRAD